jgi:hypothetical protein
MLPNIETLVTPSEQELLQMPLNTSTRFHEIDSAIEEATRKKEGEKLDNTPPLENLSLAELTSSSSTGYWITGLSISTLILIICCCYYCRGIIIRTCRECWVRRAYGPNPHPRPRRRGNVDAQLSEESVCTVNTVLLFHVIESTLEGEERGEADTTLTTEFREHTPFVARGRVPAN